MPLSYSKSETVSSFTDETGTHTTHTVTDSETGTTTVTNTSQRHGEQVPTVETTTYPSHNSGLEQASSGGQQQGGTGRIEDVSHKSQEELDKQYEENMEDEYAKREGGA